MMKYTDAGAEGEDAAGDGGKKGPREPPQGISVSCGGLGRV